MTDNTVSLPALIQVGPVTAKVCKLAIARGSAGSSPRPPDTSLTWLSTPRPQRPQSPSNRRPAPTLDLSPLGRLHRHRRNSLLAREAGSHALDKMRFGKEWPASGHGKDIQVEPLLQIKLEGAVGAD